MSQNTANSRQHYAATQQSRPAVPNAPHHAAPPPHPQHQSPRPQTMQGQPQRPQQSRPHARAPQSAPPPAAAQPQGKYRASEHVSSVLPTVDLDKPGLLGPLSFGFGANANGANTINNRSNSFIWLTVAFLIFFLLVSSSTVRNASKNEAKAKQDAVIAIAVKDADAISERLGGHVSWMNTALAMRGNARQTVNIAARGPNVTGAAILDISGNVITDFPQGGTRLSDLPKQSLPSSGVNISYVLSDGGAANPVIIQKSDDMFLALQLAPGSLIGTESLSGTTALIDRGGNPIDASGAIAANGVPSAFSLPAETVTRLANQSAPQSSVSGGSDILIASKVPNTNLTLLSRLTPPNIVVPNNLGVFVMLFLFTAALVSALLRSAISRFSQVRDTHADNRVRQERYQVAVAGGRGGVWEIDLKENNVYLNQSLSKLLGLADEDQEISIAQFLSLFHAGDRDRMLAVVRRAHMAGEMDVEVRVAHLPIVLQCRGQSSYRNITDSTVIVGVAMDITEQRGAQARLQATEARLFDSLNSMTNSFVIWDAMNRIVLWNGKFENLFGFVPGQIQVGMDKNNIEQYAQNAIEDFFEVEDNEDEIEILLKDGRWLRYSEATTADGSMVSIGNDITEIRSREQDLRENEIALRNTVSVLKKSQIRIMELAENYEQEKIRAEEASQSKSDFLANMSHELRTPLNAINGFSDIMKKEMFGPLGDPRYKEYVNDILFSGQHLLSLINDILDMSKIEAGKMTLHADALQINDIISQVVRIVRGRAEESRLKLIFDNTDMPEIEADHRAIKQVLLNLMTNAIKFTPEGGTVRVETIGKQSGIIVKVIDSGIGISQEDIDRLAKPFEQIESKHSKQHEGTGLGLALSKSLIELHGGNFLMESVVGEGTTVTFTLPNRPLVKADDAPDTEVASEITRLAQDIAEVLDASDDVLEGNQVPNSPQPQQPQAEPQAAQSPQSQPAA